MKRIALILSFIIVISALCSCANVGNRQDSEIGRAGEVVTMPRSQLPPPETESTAATDTAAPAPEDEMPYGSAASPVGKSVVISVFADDPDTAWSDADAEAQSILLGKVGSACDWISENCAAYGKTSEFVYDWTTDEALRYDAVFDTGMPAAGTAGYGKVAEYVGKNIDSAAILSKYGADNILYLFFCNTSYYNEQRPYSVTHENGADFDVEYVTVPVRYDRQYDVSPSVLAREMLHIFGAYDLSQAQFGVPQAYVDNCLATGSDDIMYAAGDGYAITERFSELTAYYTGLTDECEEIAYWGLPVAERFSDK